jgi:hypothetical protein
MLMVLFIAAATACGGNAFESGTSKDDAGDDQTSRPEASAADDGPNDSKQDGDARAPAHDAGTDSLELNCASTSLVQHSDGLGESFCDDQALGTYNVKLAEDACRAWGGDIQRSALYFTCGNGYACTDPSSHDGGIESWSCCKGKSCAVWNICGIGTGHVCLASQPLDAGPIPPVPSCCPLSSDPSWE